MLQQCISTDWIASKGAKPVSCHHWSEIVSQAASYVTVASLDPLILCYHHCGSLRAPPISFKDASLQLDAANINRVSTHGGVNKPWGWTDNIGQTRCREVKSHSASQGILGISKDPNVNYRVHNSPPLVSILKHLKLVHVFKMHCNIAPHVTSRTPGDLQLVTICSTSHPSSSPGLDFDIKTYHW
jgi:hypothetical protein